MQRNVLVGCWAWKWFGRGAGKRSRQDWLQSGRNDGGSVRRTVRDARDRRPKWWQAGEQRQARKGHCGWTERSSIGRTMSLRSGVWTQLSRGGLVPLSFPSAWWRGGERFHWPIETGSGTSDGATQSAEWTRSDIQIVIRKTHGKHSKNRLSSTRSKRLWSVYGSERGWRWFGCGPDASLRWRWAIEWQAKNDQIEGNRVNKLSSEKQRKWIHIRIKMRQIKRRRRRRRRTKYITNFNEEALVWLKDKSVWKKAKWNERLDSFL